MSPVTNSREMPFAQGGGRLLQLLPTPRCSKVQAPTLPRAELSGSLARPRCPIQTWIRFLQGWAHLGLLCPQPHPGMSQWEPPRHSQHQPRSRHFSKGCIHPQNPPKSPAKRLNSGRLGRDTDWLGLRTSLRPQGYLSDGIFRGKRSRLEVALLGKAGNNPQDQIHDGSNHSKQTTGPQGVSAINQGSALQLIN